MPGTSDRGDDQYARTVTVFNSDKFHIPEFIMVTKGFGDRMLESLFGSSNIEFSTDPEFSKHYMLNGPDQDAVKKIFTSKLRSFFTNSPKRWAASAANNNLILFTDGGFDEKLKPAEFEAYLDKTWGSI